MRKIVKYVVIDILRNRIMIAYAILLILLSLSLFALEDNTAKAMLDLLNIVLIIVPLVSLLFSVIYIYNSAEFLELLVSQPLKRGMIWLSLFLGLALSLCLTFLLGVGLPVLFFDFSATAAMLVLTGLFLTVIFIAIAMLAAVKVRDKAKGIGIAVLLWIYFTVLFDGMVLFFLFQFADYPVEKPMVAISMLNPVDIGRVMILLRMDESALMGYTGAIFRNFFGTGTGVVISFLVLLLWVLIPAMLSVRKFKNKDL
ncbi:MAG: ABC transporter permease subunit [Ferruginibacter sp.]